MYKDYSGKTIMFKIFDGHTWRWVKFRLTGRQIPEGWETGSPHAVIKKSRIELHFPIEKKSHKVKSVEKQVKDPCLKICAVDL